MACLSVVNLTFDAEELQARRAISKKYLCGPETENVVDIVTVTRSFVAMTDSREYQPIRPQDSVSAGEDVVGKRLADIGYLERQQT